MNKRSIRLLICMFFIFTFIKAVKVEASEEPESTYNTETNTIGNGEYAITKYKVDIYVNEDNTFRITESIEVYFSQEQRGIIREIPIINEVTRLDKSKSRNRAKIKDITVSENFTTKTENGYKKIRIGDENTTITGYHDYIIAYTYDIGNDKAKDYDEFYFNLVGVEWNTTISNVEFTITMPKDFDESKLGFSRGKYGSVDSSSIVYNVEDNKKISGKFLGVLQAMEGLTIRLELPEGYFAKSIDFKAMFVLLLPIIFLVVTIYLWLRYCKSERIVETVEFYPPLEYNSAQIGTFYKGKAEDKDVISLLIYLANKGYVRIKEFYDNKLVTNKKTFIIIKEKEYDGDNYYEKKFMEGLFKGEKKEATIKSLNNSFYKYIYAIKKSLNGKRIRNKMIDKKSLKKRDIVNSFIIITYLLITIIPTFKYLGEAISLILYNIFVGFVFFIMLSEATSERVRKVYMIFLILLSVVILAIPWIVLMYFVLFIEQIYIYAYIIGIICIIAMLILRKMMLKRTAFAVEIIGKIRGFRRFLRVAEKSKLEALVMEDPSYFYNILPYTYVLGISNKWIKRFETINMKAPTWYDSDTSYNFTSFNNFINATMRTSSKVMTSSAADKSSSSGGSSSSSYGGSSSGGGSSGGGSGGGGGSSW